MKPEQVPDEQPCALCHHPTDAHDLDPATGKRPCRMGAHLEAADLPCAECRRLVSEGHLDKIMRMRDDRDPALAVAFSAFTITRGRARHEFGSAADAFYTDVHESALASALIEYAAVHERQVREQVADQIAGEPRDPSSEYERGLNVAEDTARSES